MPGRRSTRPADEARGGILLPDDLLIQAGTVITMDPKRSVFETGHVLTRGGKIAAVGPGEAPRAAGERYIDARDKIIMLGFVNAHDHLDQPFYRGLFDDVAPGVRMRLLNRLTQAQTTERAYAAARLSLVELIKTGATFTAECYWVNTHPGSMHGVCRADKESGLRGLLSRAMVTNNPLNPALSQSWPNVRAQVEGLKSAWDSDKITITAEALSLGACDDDTVRAIDQGDRA